ncbi:hypothetical protein BKA21_000281 [Cellulomonas oligotrophica]|nr:hypothetical protein [Cellulomonas oligotrophica]
MVTALLPDLAPTDLLPVDVDERAAALGWETTRVWAAWAWLDDTTDRSSWLPSAPRHRCHGRRGAPSIRPDLRVR